jgi:hypothetical protein
MTHEPMKKITVSEGSSLAKLLTDAATRPILLEKNGELYRLERMETEGKRSAPRKLPDPVMGSSKLPAVGRAWTQRRLKRISRIADILPIVHQSSYE